MSGVDPSAGRRVRSLLLNPGYLYGSRVLTCIATPAIRQTEHPGCLAVMPLRIPGPTELIHKTALTSRPVHQRPPNRESLIESQWQAIGQLTSRPCVGTLTTMNIKGSHFRISASMRGDDGFRAKLSKNVSYLRMKDGLFSLYLVQLRYQHNLRMRRSLTRYP